MAEKGKEFPLTIALRAIDRATGPLRRVNDRISKLTAPIRQVRAGIGRLGEESGLPKLAAAFGGVRAAVGGLLTKLGLVAGAGVAAAAGIKRMIENLDGLGISAARAGLTADALAQIRYAASLAGASTQDVDAAFETFNKTMGELRNGTGPLVDLLSKVSPALLKTLKATDSTEEAFDVLADAIAKLPDAERKALLADKAFGGAGAKLVPLLSKGSKEIKEQRTEYTELAGSQEEATKTAATFGAAMKRLGAVLDGIKAAIVTGLGPAFTELVTRVKEFLQANRGRITAWVSDFGKRLPDAVRGAVSALKGALDVIRPVWEAIGGLSGAAQILGAVLAGKLVYAVYTLGTAILTTPIGWLLAGIAAITAAAVYLIKNWAYFREFWEKLWDGVKEVVGKAWGFVKGSFDEILGGIREVTEALASFGRQFSGEVGEDEREALEARGLINPSTGQFANPIMNGWRPPPSVAAPKSEKREIEVKFVNTPKGTRVDTKGPADDSVDLSVGYQLFFGT